MSDAKQDTETPRKKGGKMKWIVIGLGALVLAGGGVGGGLYATGMIGGSNEVAAKGPRLVPKSEQVRAGGEGEKSEGEQYASAYYPLEKEFTSNLRDSVHFIQVGLAVSTPYDASVIENVKTHEIAVRSAVLMALGETDEEQVFTAQGKQALQKRLIAAINETLKEKEGFGGIGNVYFTNFIVQ